MTATRILCIHHATQRADRVSRLLADAGCRVDWVNPVHGDALPDDRDGFDAVVVYGGEHSVNDRCDHVAREQAWIDRWVGEGRPYLGLCLGAQFLARACGGRVSRHPRGLLENGFVRLHPEPAPAPLFDAPTYVFQWHNEGFDLPAGCTLLATGGRFENQAFSAAPDIVGLQFHPEVTAAIMFQWFREGGHMLTGPGAQPAEVQLRDAVVFDPLVERWTEDFLDNWLTGIRRRLAPEQRRHG